MGFPPSRKEETWEEEEGDSEEAVIYQAEHERNERRNERPCPLFDVLRRVADGREGERLER